MTTLAPLADTQRIIEWDELPERVREIPENFDPLAEGVLMAHQKEWVRVINTFDLAVGEKNRRSGITLSTALNDSITAASRKSAGGCNIYYIGDTQQKGIEFIGYCAKFARKIVAAQGEGMSEIEQFIFEDQAKRGEATREITAFRIRFSSGFRIVALSSRPENIHGLQGIVNIDEAALHKNVRDVLESATALLIWGGRIRVFSTHRGAKNPFNDLVRDVRQGRYGSTATVFKCTFDECVANGLYERVCWMQGKQPTPEGKKEWYTRIRKLYGPRKAAMLEELDVIPREGEGQAIPGVWIEAAMREERPVLRIVLDDDFAKQSEESRKKWGETWIKNHLEPVLSTLDKSDRHFFGMDFARRRHMSVICPMAKRANLVRKVPFVVEMSNVPTRQQEQILWYIIPRLPRFCGGAMDATGPGQTLAEYTAARWSSVEPVEMSNAWYRDQMGPFVQSFEDGAIDLPKDAELESDLRDLDRIDGIVKLGKEAEVTDAEAGTTRHGDFAIACALGHYASRKDKNVIEEFPMPNKRDRFEGTGRDEQFDDLAPAGCW
jgi:phage FluMu gp28-like protein